MTIQISKEATVKQLMDVVLATFDVQRDQIRLWDYHGERRCVDFSFLHFYISLSLFSPTKD